MNLKEVLVDVNTVADDELEDESDLVLTQYSDDDVIPDELRELSELLVGVESAVQARMILALFFPELEWGGQEVWCPYSCWIKLIPEAQQVTLFNHTSVNSGVDGINENANQIIEKLNSATSESDLRRIIWEVFSEMFMGEIVGDSGSKEYQDAVFDAWKYYCR